MEIKMNLFGTTLKVLWKNFTMSIICHLREVKQGNKVVVILGVIGSFNSIQSFIGLPNL